MQSSRFSVGLFACCLPRPGLLRPVLCSDPCTDPARLYSARLDSVPNEERSIHLNVCHLLRCRRNVCLFAAPPALLLRLFCLCLALHLMLLLLFYLSVVVVVAVVGKKRHRHRRHPSPASVSIDHQRSRLSSRYISPGLSS